jgi:hypothetical protein
MFYETATELGVFSGPLKNIDANLFRLKKHIFVGDTLDGGASVWLRRPNPDGQEVPRFKENSDQIPWTWPEKPQPQNDAESVPLVCHCKGVNLRLHRAAKRDDSKWFLDPRDKNKRLASFDACDSCRLHFGNDIVHWTFADLADVSQADGSAFPASMDRLKQAVDSGDPAVGTLACYQSSPDAQRYFCRVCSAAVFYLCDDRPEMADVAIGLLDSPDGARAEGLLSWNLGDTPVWVGDTKGGWREGLMKRVQNDAEEFRIAGGYPKGWHRLAREAKAASESK